MDIIKYIKEISIVKKIIICSSNQSVCQKEILKIEQYLSHKVPYETTAVLKKYQGCSFEDNVSFKVTNRIPILGDSKLLDFGIFLTLSESHYQIREILINNEDLFQKRFIPIIEATPGDYIAQDIITMEIYFISHDFDSQKESGKYKIAKSLTDFLLNLSISSDNDSHNIKSSNIINVSYSNDLLEMMANYKKNNS